MSPFEFEVLVHVVVMFATFRTNFTLLSHHVPPPHATHVACAMQHLAAEDATPFLAQVVQLMCTVALRDITPLKLQHLPSPWARSLKIPTINPSSEH